MFEFATLCYGGYHGSMASHYTRSDSPFYWLRHQRPDGTWGSKRTEIRIDDEDAKRKLKMILGREAVKEATRNPQVGQERGWGWVPTYLQARYTHPISRRRAFNAWAPISVFVDWRGIESPGQLQRKHGLEYVQWRQEPPPGTVKKMSKNTAIHELKTLGMVMQEALTRDMCAGNPIHRLGLKKDAPKKKPEFLREEQEKVEEALKTAPQWMQDQWLVAMRHGCRLSEVRVPMHEVDLQDKVILFRGKKGKEHWAPLHPDIEPLVMRRRKESAQVLVEIPDNASRIWRRFFNKLGLPHSFHSTRVSVVSRLVRGGHTVAQIMQYVGHASATVNEIYRRHRPIDVAHLGKVLQ